jgi:hypothetical protein
MAGPGAGAATAFTARPPRDTASARALADRLLAGSLSDQIRTTAALQAIAPRFGRAAAKAPSLEGVPASLRAPVGDLLGAIARARVLRDEAFGGRSEAEITALVSGLRARAPGGVVTTEANAPRLERPSLEQMAPSIPPDVDLGKLVGASIVVTDAIARSMPALRAAQGQAGPSIDQCPRFAIDTSGDTTYTGRCALIIDLAGNDTYAGPEGVSDSSTPVSVVIDTAGNDRYERAADADTLAAHGAGVGGVGMVVDATGNDRYSALNVRTVPDFTSGTGKDAFTVAQGAGLGGVGVLADGGGDDVFTASAVTKGAATGGGGGTVVAQGAGSLGVGVLVHGPGTAKYDASGQSGLLKVTPSLSVAGLSQVVAQGGGFIGGAGALIDVGGADSYTGLATMGGAGIAVGQGGGALGAGVLVDGDGVDSYALNAIDDATLDIEIHCTTNCSASVSTHVNFGAAQVVGQGGAAVGAGIAADLGDDENSHTIIASSKATAISVADCVGCPSPGFLAASAEADAQAAHVNAHGSGDAGSGVALGGEGKDVYSITASSDAKAVAKAASFSSAIANGGDSDARGQGESAVGAGVLADAGGDDTYAFAQSATATATASPGGTALATPGTVITSGRANALAPGVAMLADLGGNDTYSDLPSGAGVKGANNSCWTNSPPDLPDLSIAIGADVNGSVPSSCVPPPNVS